MFGKRGTTDTSVGNVRHETAKQQPQHRRRTQGYGQHPRPSGRRSDATIHQSTLHCHAVRAPSADQWGLHENQHALYGFMFFSELHYDRYTSVCERNLGIPYNHTHGSGAPQTNNNDAVASQHLEGAHHHELDILRTVVRQHNSSRYGRQTTVFVEGSVTINWPCPHLGASDTATHDRVTCFQHAPTSISDITSYCRSSRRAKKGLTSQASTQK